MDSEGRRVGGIIVRLSEEELRNAGQKRGKLPGGRQDARRTAMGLVPNSAWLEPWGATYSGDCDRTTPTRPRSASRRAQNLPPCCNGVAMLLCNLQSGRDQRRAKAGAWQGRRPVVRPCVRPPRPAIMFRHDVNKMKAALELADAPCTNHPRSHFPLLCHIMSLDDLLLCLASTKRWSSHLHRLCCAGWQHVCRACLAHIGCADNAKWDSA